MNTVYRPTFHEIYMDLACSLARRSSCKRLQVGTVISSVDFRKIYSVGYNGNATGLGNGCDSETPGNCGCLHSEENATINCDISRHLDKIVFVTHAPCKMCAKRLINLGGVKEVYYLEAYRSNEGIQLLKSTGVIIVQFEPKT